MIHKLLKLGVDVNLLDYKGASVLHRTSDRETMKVGHTLTLCSGPCIIRPPLQPDKYGLKLEVILKWMDIYTENIRMVLLIAGLQMEGIVKWRGLKSQGHVPVLHISSEGVCCYGTAVPL